MKQSLGLPRDAEGKGLGAGIASMCLEEKQSVEAVEQSPIHSLQSRSQPVAAGRPRCDANRDDDPGDESEHGNQPKKRGREGLVSEPSADNRLGDDQEEQTDNGSQ